MLPRDNQRDVSKGVVDVIRDLQVRLRRLESLPLNDTIVLLGDTSLAALSTTFDFNNISQDFRHLLLRLSVRSTVAAVTDHLHILLNGDSGANYEAVRVEIQHNANLQTSETLAATNMNLNEITGGSADADHFASVVLQIIDYTNNNKFKTIFGTGGHSIGVTTADIITTQATGIWLDTSAISRIQIVTHGGDDFAIGSRVTLYGVR